jgi:peroxiredoxin
MLSLEAPDFTLPDVSGTPHSLSDYRGKKVLLATWASW